MPGRKPIASFYSPKEYQEWQKAAAAALKEFRAANAEVPTWPVECRVECRVLRPKTTKLLIPKPDVDNYAKGVLDAITKDGRFWVDDTQVADLIVKKRWTTDAMPEGIYVSIFPLDPKDL